MREQSPESAAKPDRPVHLWVKRIGWFAVMATATVAIALLLVYTTAGDTTVWGEALTVFPPVLWLVPLITLAVIGVMFARSGKAAAIAAGSILVFSLGTVEWLPLLRSEQLAPPGLHSASIRVVTWNIAGRSDWQDTLKQLDRVKPDIVFLQETPDGENSLTTESLSGPWQGYSWWDQGDCGILSRYKLNPLPSSKIGPWDKPALAIIEVAPFTVRPLTTHTILLCNVRMMMPAAAISGVTNWAERERQHPERVGQYSELERLITERRNLHDAEQVILGGDFNVRGGSKSLRPLIDAGLKDVWPESGAGWGATFMSDFPVARIDQVWASEKLQPIRSFAVRGTVSDHKMLVANIKLP